MSEAVESNSRKSTTEAYHRRLLEEQRERMNQVFIGIPDQHIQTEKEQREIFQKICDRLNVNIPLSQIEGMHCMRNALIVKFRDRKSKEMIMDSADKKKVWLDQILDVQSTWWISFRHYMTGHFEKLYERALEYKKAGSLYSLKLTDQGLVVRRKENSTGRIILSINELNEYVGISK